MAGTAGCGGFLGTEEGTEEQADETETDTDPRVAVVRKFFLAIDAGDGETANRLVVEQYSAGVAISSEKDIESVDAHVVKDNGDRATVEASITYSTPDIEETVTKKTKLDVVKTDDGWKLTNLVRSESEETDDSSTEQVTNRLDVVSAVGENIAEGKVRTVMVTVKRALGAANIDLSETIVQWVDDSGVYDLVYGDTDEGFTVETIKDDDVSLSGESPVLNDPTDRALLRFELESFRGSGLLEGTSAELQINTQSGGTSNVILNGPSALEGKEAVVL